MKSKKRLGTLLTDIGIITEEQLNLALEIQKSSNLKLGEILLREKLTTRDQLVPVLEYQYGVPFVDLSRYVIDKSAVKMVNESLARKYCLIAAKYENGRLTIIMSDPMDLLAKDYIKMSTGYTLDVVMSFESDIMRSIDQFYDASEIVTSAFEELEEEHLEELRLLEESMSVDAGDDEIARSPVVRVVNTIISRAVKTGSSDIHIEPFEDSVRVRFRIDGDLRVEMNPPKSSYAALVTRIKILSGMDISEKRIPQDGRIETKVDGKEVDLRVSLLPTIYGEKIVIRILDRSSIMMTKEMIGFTPYNIEIFDKIIQASEGIILLTGPTGSGKTTTLYAVLRELNKVKSNIITAEDPVEYKLEGVNQVHINAKAGMTFAAALRSILRQDPDIIMVGEIRDGETAEIAIRAAITGHVVLSTLHTNDTVSTISRLIDMGIEPFMVSTSVVGIIAQRLVKRICVKCKIDIPVTQKEKDMLKDQTITHIKKGAGCNTCNGTGYKGRIAVHEILALNRELKTLITQNRPIDELRDAAERGGLKNLTASCRDLVKEGTTTIEEMIKVAYSIDE